ncbi:MAG: hypothetical protein D6720_11740 [Gammaproteobacteria bacterium]|nr:MAG: hypothetical protein D6720_11740 [Gammaproteobacteria bacterium]
MTSPPIRALALDLEGTLIADATSRVPRPGLARFLRSVRQRFPRIVTFTSVSEERFRDVANQLVAEAKAPPWLAHLEHLKPQGTKDLSLIPGVHWQEALLVDDCEAYVHPGQASQWIEIRQFAYPYPADDLELERILRDLRVRSPL